MLYDGVHKPVQTRHCAQCHELPVAGQPLRTRRQGLELCRSCHAEKVAQMLDKASVHRPLLDPAACLSCHSPHASRQPALLAAPQLQTCGSCHADTIARQKLSPTKHKPVAEGRCTDCHDPHATDGALLLGEKHQPASCTPCHANMNHSSHPLGDQFKDPRNPNRTLDCLSCHRAHGTEHKHLLPAAKSTELCVQCHERFKR
jgi:predicted CXXCH cytochrome family protein